jgi:hypothetical protein
VKILELYFWHQNKVIDDADCLDAIAGIGSGRGPTSLRTGKSKNNRVAENLQD